MKRKNRSMKHQKSVDKGIVLLQGINKTNKKKKERNFTEMLKQQINQRRKKHKIHVYGSDVPAPVDEFIELRCRYKLSEELIGNIAGVGYLTPTPVQMQAIPLLSEKREALVCAPTGSGKTAAFLLPVLHQLGTGKKEGFRAVIVAPSRELADQIYRECIRLSEDLNFRVYIMKEFKSVSKIGQKFDIMITTPKRLTFLLKQQPPVVNLEKVEWLVLDEADKLFEGDFRNQLAEIQTACSAARRVMFSATFSDTAQSWCRLHLDNLVTVTVGARNSAATTVEQQLIYVGDEAGKLLAMRNLIKEGISPPVLIFVQSIDRAKELYRELLFDGIHVEVIHSDRTEEQREKVVKEFRQGVVWVLICTELLGRGMDFCNVNLVINYDFPQSIVNYIHRVGRTGRAGVAGKAVTFFTEEDRPNLRSVAKIVRSSGSKVDKYMLEMPKQRKRRHKHTIVDRESISTETLYDKEKKEKLKRRINKSTEKRSKRRHHGNKR